MEDRRPRPELLAPAGSPACLLSALEAGADAVYAGTPLFSARGRAANFTLDELAAAAALCRKEGRRLYAAVNTLVLDRELPALAETLLALSGTGVDAVILQDPGVALLARELFPSLPLHASTQMTIHDLPGLHEASERGFRRVVLARELPLPRVAELARSSPVELEVFVHGALCHCVSGQCLLSSWMGGRSGNRGWCAQPCRRRFDLPGEPPYPFSTRDLSALSAVPALAAAGVASLKIEGRMKPPAWVGAVVAAYRAVLDAPPGGEAEAVARGEEVLSRLAGRERTGGLLLGDGPRRVAGLDRRASFGEALGTVESTGDGTAIFVTRERIHAGDRLRWVPSDDREGRSFILRPFLSGGRETTVAEGGKRVQVPLPFPARVGDTIERAGEDGPDRRAVPPGRWALASPEPVPVRVVARADGDRVTLLAEGGGAAAEAFAEGLQPARPGGPELSAVLRERLSETGGTPFRLAESNLEALSGLFLPPSRVKELRRRLYAGLDSSRERLASERRDATLRAARELLPPPLSRPAPVGGGSPGRPLLAARVEGPAEALFLESHGAADRYLLPLPESAAACRDAASAFSGMEGRVLFSLPFWCPSGETADREDRAVADLLARGFSRFEADNPSHLRRLSAAGAWVLAGFRLHAMNRLALRALASRGARAVLLSPEDDGDNLRTLLDAPPPPERWVYLYGRVPLLSSLTGPTPPAPREVVAPGRMERFTVTGEGGVSVLRPEVPMCLSRHAGRLSPADAVLADLSGVPRDDRARLLRALREGSPVPGTVPFNFDRRLA